MIQIVGEVLLSCPCFPFFLHSLVLWTIKIRERALELLIFHQHILFSHG